MPRKFLIIQTAFIGDVVLATSIAENLHASFPEAQIDFLLRMGNEGLLNGHPYLHEVLIWNKKKNKLRNLFKLLKQLRRNRYDKVINIQRYGATGILTAFSGAEETIGFDKNPFSFLFSKRVKHVFSTRPDNADKNTLHEIDRNNMLIADFTNTAPARPRLYPSSADMTSVDRYKQTPYLTISPASVWFTKQYPPDKWISFINKVPHQYTLYLLGGPGDSGLAAEIKSKVTHPSVLVLCGELGFLQSAALMKDALMNYANDSAPMHFASAVNAPVTAVYCSTVPSFGYGPLSDKSFIVEKTAPLYCRPCGLHGYRACPQGHFKCALDIEDSQLLRSISGLE